MGYYAFRIIGALIILLTVWAVTFSRGLLVLVMVLAVPSILQHLFFHPHSLGMLPFINRILSIGFDLIIIAIISQHIFKTEQPNSETIFGALCIYLLLGFTFASIYSAISNRVQDAFYLAPTLNHHAIPDRFDFIYFSFGTLTELGTPGITAVAPLARSISLLEAILGVLYMAVLLSRLINAYRGVETSNIGREEKIYAARRGSRE
ncbi:ion channel [Granulicella sibirica]|uniref:Potassium channel protein n=1 Tax=Granulicella sibirica TaxID=2479048 RepID=A0A4Q0T3E3_9BACT|nr:ion channel [Granulicella sibirica]RXH57787.1 Potassium channel protein [Granulicella sibirica]